MPPKKPATGKQKPRDAGLSAVERAALKDRARELKAGKGDGEAALREKIAELTGADRTMATRLHQVIMTAAPALAPRTWYGMPAWARGDKVICFFQAARKFGTRYATLGFSDKAALDDGTMWPTSFALVALGPAEEARIIALVRRAMIEESP